MTGVDVPGDELPTDAARLAPLPRRLLDAFFTPGKMVREVAEHPRWLGALLICMGLVAFSTWLIPPELFIEAQRRAALERGVDFPALSDNAIQTFRLIAVVGGALSFGIIALLISGLYTVIFAFILGDEGRFEQYFAIMVHAAFIPAFLSVPLAPLRVATGDVQFSLSLGSFFVFLPDGYFLNVLRVMDLTQIWSTLVVALGATAIDHRRGFASAAAVMFLILLAFALIVANFLPG